MAFTRISTPVGWAISDENSDGEWFQIGASGLTATEEQIDYAVMLLNNGIERDDLIEYVLYTNCVSCDKTFMQGQLDASKRCVACQS